MIIIAITYVNISYTEVNAVIIIWIIMLVSQVTWMVPLQGLFKWTLNIPSKFTGDNQQTIQPTLSTSEVQWLKHIEEKEPKSTHAKLSYLLYALPNVEWVSYPALTLN